MREISPFALDFQTRKRVKSARGIGCRSGRSRYRRDPDYKSGAEASQLTVLSRALNAAAKLFQIALTFIRDDENDL
jgi:hypothetical protein